MFISGKADTVRPAPSKEPPKMILSKNITFGFSSPFGQSLLLNNSKKDLVGNALKCIQQYEMFCNGVQRIGKSRESYDLRASYKMAGKNSNNEHCHQYCFTRRERLDRYAQLRSERYLTMKSGLDAHSRKLLSKMKKCSVRVKKCVPSKRAVQTKTYSPPIVINLCSSDEEL